METEETCLVAEEACLEIKTNLISFSNSKMTFIMNLVDSFRIKFITTSSTIRSIPLGNQAFTRISGISTNEELMPSIVLVIVKQI